MSPRLLMCGVIILGLFSYLPIQFSMPGGRLSFCAQYGLFQTGYNRVPLLLRSAGGRLNKTTLQRSVSIFCLQASVTLPSTISLWGVLEDKH